MARGAAARRGTGAQGRVRDAAGARSSAIPVGRRQRGSVLHRLPRRGVGAGQVLGHLRKACLRVRRALPAQAMGGACPKRRDHCNCNMQPCPVDCVASVWSRGRCLAQASARASATAPTGATHGGAACPDVRVARLPRAQLRADGVADAGTTPPPTPRPTPRSTAAPTRRHQPPPPFTLPSWIHLPPRTPSAVSERTPHVAEESGMSRCRRTAGTTCLPTFRARPARAPAAQRQGRGGGCGRRSVRGPARIPAAARHRACPAAPGAERRPQLQTPW